MIFVRLQRDHREPPSAATAARMPPPGRCLCRSTSVMKVHYWSKGQVWGTFQSRHIRGVVQPPPIPTLHGSDVALRRVKTDSDYQVIPTPNWVVCIKSGFLGGFGICGPRDMYKSTSYRFSAYLCRWSHCAEIFFQKY